MFIEMINSVIQLFLRHPIRKLLVSVNQSSHLICFYYHFFDGAKETNIHEIKLRRPRLQILTCFSFVLKKPRFH